MSIGDGCGPHCGSQNGAEKHCDCTGCQCLRAGTAATRPAIITGVPMCDQWYGRSRRWDEDHPPEADVTLEVSP